MAKLFMSPDKKDVALRLNRHDVKALERVRKLSNLIDALDEDDPTGIGFDPASKETFEYLALKRLYSDCDEVLKAGSKPGPAHGANEWHAEDGWPLVLLLSGSPYV